MLAVLFTVFGLMISIQGLWLTIESTGMLRILLKGVTSFCVVIAFSYSINAYRLRNLVDEANKAGKL
jgi:hypothetical protein